MLQNLYSEYFLIRFKVSVSVLESLAYEMESTLESSSNIEYPRVPYRYLISDQ